MTLFLNNNFETELELYCNKIEIKMKYNFSHVLKSFNKRKPISLNFEGAREIPICIAISKKEAKV